MRTTTRAARAITYVYKVTPKIFDLVARNERPTETEARHERDLAALIERATGVDALLAACEAADPMMSAHERNCCCCPERGGRDCPDSKAGRMVRAAIAKAKPKGDE